MRGSAVFRTGIAPGGALAPGWVKNELWRKARTVPSLDLRFADNKSLVDAVTGAQLVTFTRASSGTFLGSDGVLRTAVTNLLLRSEEFDNASWTKVATTVLANQIQSPIGTLTADEIIEDSSTGNHYVTNGSVSSSVSGTAYTYSVYVKAGQRAFCFLLANGTGTLQVVSVNLSTGVATSAVGSPSLITSTDVGNGWYRISFSYTSGTTGSVGHEVRLSTNGIWGDRSYTGNGAGSVYAWGAQLEQSATVGEYIPTTSAINSAPRFDHNPITGESLGLLPEEARTNSFVRSEEFGTTWTAAGLSSITADAATAPNGAATADTLVETTGVSEIHRVLQNTSITSGSSYTVSAFAKQAQRRYCYLLFTPNSTWNGTSTIAYFDLQTGTIVNTANCTATITAFPDGWYRLTATTTATATNAAAPIGIGSSSTGNVQTYTGDGSNAITVWGAQFETGSFATSYIPTTTATVTRAADVASITGSAFSSWYRQDEGTVFADAPGIYATGSVCTFSDGSNNNRILFDHGTNTRRARFISGGNDQAAFSPSYTYGTQLKTSISYASNYFSMANAGVLASGAPDTSGLLPVGIDRIFIGSNATGTGAYSNTSIRRLTYWPTRPADTTLQQITQ